MSQVIPHALAVHVGCEAEADMHTIPHIPQLSGSLVRSTQASPHIIRPPLHIATHVKLVPLAWHSGVGSSQVVEQLPHVAAVESDDSQPLTTASPSHSAQPMSHWSWQDPMTQEVDPF